VPCAPGKIHASLAEVAVSGSISVSPRNTLPGTGTRQHAVPSQCSTSAPQPGRLAQRPGIPRAGRHDRGQAVGPAMPPQSPPSPQCRTTCDFISVVALLYDKTMTVAIVVQREGGLPEEIAELTDKLRTELLESGVADVRRLQEGDVPVGAKGGAFPWAELLVTSVSGGVPALMGAILSWVRRGSGRSVTVELDGDRLEVAGISSEQQERLIAQWIDRHDG